MLLGMRASLLLGLILAIAAFAVPARAQTAGVRADAVVELFTSQGCAQCPRANRLVGQYVGEDHVLALTFAVDIWDYLGWTDTFARPEFNARQREYAHALRARGRYTPQLVINGVRQLNAYDWTEARAEFDQTRQRGMLLGPGDLSIVRLRSGRVRVTLGANAQASGAEVWLAAYDPRPLLVEVTAGLNRNRTIAHYNVVRSLDRLDVWDGRPAYFERGRCTPECAVIVQAADGGPIYGAAYTVRDR